MGDIWRALPPCTVSPLRRFSLRRVETNLVIVRVAPELATPAQVVARLNQVGRTREKRTLLEEGYQI